MERNITRDPMLEMYLFESSQLLEQLEQVILASEKSKNYSSEEINEVFRIMHTIKGSSAMMMFDSIAKLAHSLEDLFYFLREDKPRLTEYSRISDFVLLGADFMKNELAKIEDGLQPDGAAHPLVNSLKEYLALLRDTNCRNPADCLPETSPVEPVVQQRYYISRNTPSTMTELQAYKARVFFEDGCQMENIRAFTVIHKLREMASEIFHTPPDIIENDDSIETIRTQGFEILFQSEKPFRELEEFFQQTVYLKHLEFGRLEAADEIAEAKNREISTRQSAEPIIPKILQREQEPEEKDTQSKGSHQKIISVNVSKLDKLMDLVGELVISEVMVTQNPDLKGLKLDNFNKVARQLKKITGELQDIVMSIRMVPLSSTFQKMNRIVRDMCRKLDKDVELVILGEETEVDKNIIEHISDPLMHLIRNSLDHGIEPIEERTAKGKPDTGKIVLEAKNAGGDVLISVKDDGRGLNRAKILAKARENGLVNKPDGELTDKEIFNFIFLPGFSTKTTVTEFSGRGVGMDVVTKNIEMVGGSVTIDSIENGGTTILLKIPLTLAIIDGMNIKVGESRYTIPTTEIKESFRPREQDLIRDPDGNEMIMVRGKCYPILRLHQFYRVRTAVTDLSKGILIMVEQDNRVLCLFADELLGQQQVVVKALPNYIRNFRKIPGLGGCTLLGDGNISLILDIDGLAG